MPKKVKYAIGLPEEGSIYQQEKPCAILYALDVIGGKWKLPIIWYLAGSESVRFNELRRRVHGITNIMLTKCLRELESSGLVERMQFNEVPPHVEYRLTETGRRLLPALNEIYAWGEALWDSRMGKDGGTGKTR